MLKKELTSRGVPKILDGVETIEQWESKREEIKELLQHEEYGYLPPAPDRVEFSEEVILENFAAGKAELKKITISAYWGDKNFSFPAYSTVPAIDNCPAFIHINFRDNVPDRYMSNEEIMDNGYAVFSFCYNDVSTDDDDFTNGLAGVLYENGQRNDTDCGKIAMWAWAAMRVMDYVQTISSIDKSRIAVCGHSRLGKTALLTGAFDDRFYCAFSNDSGCSGAALSRRNKGETVEAICNQFPRWFCKNYYKYKGKETDLPFDQHFLIALMAPRYAYVASAVGDWWADPPSEQLSAFAASEVWELYGKPGLICKNEYASTGDKFHAGYVGYHMRKGLHYFSREDWLLYFEFLNSK